MLKTLAILFLSLSIAACFRVLDKSSSSNLNNNGNITDKKTFPNVVQIQRVEDASGSMYESVCTGVFMGTYVLTAAHCVLKNSASGDLKNTYAPDQFSLVLNGDDYEIEPIRFEIHPDIKVDPMGVVKYPDLAKLHLPAKSWTKVTPARIANKPPEQNDLINIVGFGSLSYNKINWAGDFRSGKNKVATSDYKWIVTLGMLEENPKNNHTASFYGDSGAPLFNTNNEVIGILLASGKTDPRKPDLYGRNIANIYTNIVTPKIRNWISCH